MTEQPWTDPRPWSCVLCSDRFKHDQTERGRGHQTVLKPRTEPSRRRVNPDTSKPVAVILPEGPKNS